ncbi:FAD binding domain-containing protein [Rhodoligotrophos defluvii]|uniref:FAD binding domain-containing protein n=1 Tax=Rhodoligotrophos defluvii TaxID=2561934 RepID=UPI001EF0E8DC|nr:FAD binding domain-containing protein [Rhodoligotrophos defluvii]
MSAAMSSQQAETIHMAASVDDALAALRDHGAQAAPLAGATWIMRAPIRGERLRPAYVGLGAIPELCAVEVADDEISIGACVTHARLAAALHGIRGCQGLVAAASGAANPAVRQMATVGGNLCTADFPASDLAPALLCLDASVELCTAAGRDRVPIGRFLELRRDLEPATLLTKVTLKRRPLRCAHARLPLRRAGDYPVAIVSMAAASAGDGSIDDIRIAVGSVEATARRWPELEQRFRGRKLDAAEAEELAKAASRAFRGRDGIEAPGWYRVQVLPALVRRCAETIMAPAETEE